MKIKNEIEISTSEPYYDLFEGGYIKPAEILEDEKDIEKVREAIAIISEFLDSCEKQIPGFIN